MIRLTWKTDQTRPSPPRRLPPPLSPRGAPPTQGATTSPELVSGSSGSYPPPNPSPTSGGRSVFGVLVNHRRATAQLSAAAPTLPVQIRRSAALHSQQWSLHNNAALNALSIMARALVSPPGLDVPSSTVSSGDHRGPSPGTRLPYYRLTKTPTATSPHTSSSGDSNSGSTTAATTAAAPVVDATSTTAHEASTQRVRVSRCLRRARDCPSIVTAFSAHPPAVLTPYAALPRTVPLRLNNRMTARFSNSRSAPPSRDAVQESKLPECPGSCVSPLLSILCDHVSTVHSCPTGGSCCVSAAATTTEPPIPACDGPLPPALLEWVCQKPAQLVLRTTTCPSGTICCSQPERDQRPGGGYFAPQQGTPMRQQRPPMQQQRPFGAIIPQERANDQLNAVIPVDQAMMDQLALEKWRWGTPAAPARAPRSATARENQTFPTGNLLRCPRKDHKEEFGQSNRELAHRSD
ncbi:hypothetical protein HPB49_021440 [Dermacentor silvarum]|uniref:Uncharacterized protein n=1 Tax=Dermacentor silvarum TaxID=543639 RepID=A0ACB8CMZ8_DERSI|nr:hypothetical protein HPB49_021440 [Dermacentor silvarum]